MKRFSAVVLLFILAGCANIPPSGTAHILNFIPGHMPYYAGYGFFIGDKGCFITTFHQKHSFARGVPRVYSGSKEYRIEFLQGIPELEVALFRTGEATVSLPLIENIDGEVLGKKVFIRSGADMFEATVADDWILYDLSPEPFIPGLSTRRFLAYKIIGGDLRRGKSGSVVVNSKGEVFAIVTAIMEGAEPFGVAVPISHSLLYTFLTYHKC